MIGHWQKEIPSKQGQYWTADRNGQQAGIKVVAYLGSELVYAGGSIGYDFSWKGWWWSEPVELPPDPPRWEE